MAYYGDSDAQETQEWQDAFDSVLQHMGTDRAAFLLEKIISTSNFEACTYSASKYPLFKYHSS